MAETLVQRSLEGDTLRIIETRHRRPQLSASEERVIQKGLRGVGLDRSDFSIVRPLVQAIHVLDDGHVLVQVVEEVGEDSELLDVFNPEGRFLGSIRSGFPLNRRAIPALVGDTIIATTLDEPDVPYVVRATIRR